MKTADLIRELQTMPPDMPVHFWANDERQQIAEVRNVGDCVDLYEDETEDTQHAADTFADMLEALYIALPYVEDHAGSDIYKAGAVTKALNIIRAAIKQAESMQ